MPLIPISRKLSVSGKRFQDFRKIVLNSKKCSWFCSNVYISTRSWYLWVFVVLFLLLNIAGEMTSFNFDPNQVSSFFLFRCNDHRLHLSCSMACLLLASFYSIDCKSLNRSTMSILQTHLDQNLFYAIFSSASACRGDEVGAYHHRFGSWSCRETHCCGRRFSSPTIRWFILVSKSPASFLLDPFHSFPKLLWISLLLLYPRKCTRTINQSKPF